MGGDGMREAGEVYVSKEGGGSCAYWLRLFEKKLRVRPVVKGR